MASISVEPFTPPTNLNRARQVEVGSNQSSANQQHDTKRSSEYYIMVRGADIIFPHNECQWFAKSSHKRVLNDIEKHLQAILQLLRPCDTMKMAVKLESLLGSHRTRYLLVVSNGTDESCLIGVDYENGASIGLVLPFWNDMEITLDGDGGFRISNAKRHHIFKPVSVQAMWSAFQALHLAKKKACKNNYYQNGGSHLWVTHYQKRIKSNRKCLQEWHAITDFAEVGNQLCEHENKPQEQRNFEEFLSSNLKNIMMSLDLEQVTSKEIRNKLEQIVKRDLTEYKSFIDNQMIRIMGQLEEPSKILDYLYLGSEWNASNYEELRDKGVKKILNVTCEIENFFPGMFDYYNIRVLDDDNTDMLRYLNDTYGYIRKAKDDGEKVLVHCKKGISRSASVVIAYIMKEKNFDLYEALTFVQNNRKIIRPNPEFLKQLEIYQGMLKSNNKWKSNSESDLDEMFSKKTKNKNYSFSNRAKMIKPESDQNDENQIKAGSLRRRSWPPKTCSNTDYLIFESDKDLNDKQPLYPVDQERKSRVKEKIEGFENNRNSSNQSKNLKKNFTKNGVVSNLAFQFESKDKVLLKDVSNLDVKSAKPPLPRSYRFAPTASRPQVDGSKLGFGVNSKLQTYSSCDNINVDHHRQSIDKLLSYTLARSKSSSELDKRNENEIKKKKMNDYYDILVCEQNSVRNLPLDQYLSSFINPQSIVNFEGLVERRTKELEELKNSHKEMRCNAINKSNSMPSSPSLREHLKQCQANNNNVDGKNGKSNITCHSQSFTARTFVFSTVPSGDRQVSRASNTTNDSSSGTDRKKKTYGKTHPLGMWRKGNAL